MNVYRLKSDAYRPYWRKRERKGQRIQTFEQAKTHDLKTIYIYITLETQTKAANRTRIRYSLFLIAFRPLWLGPWAPRSAERSRPPQPSRGPTRSHTGRVPGGGCACCRNIRLPIATHIKKTCLVSCLVSRENCWMLSVQSFLQVFASPRLSQGVKKRRVS